MTRLGMVRKEKNTCKKKIASAKLQDWKSLVYFFSIGAYCELMVRR